ncbi:sigma-70 family RNA polymerase sigma factor [Heliobacterium undosum]|uniref:Sigma-70 family RNA polymerase sigma factor n=1 Tax=Heliomicrobium undosum TaxID=121734 RepID=A0A845L4G7_9FIRM|nr:sigma-70 family RNA polymerase sigma factor [Heliomicrobium undosum]MZP29530.1 sigma-70 family RNA polymerase sigma factor [Heliomicrobium undosum]
MDTVHNLVRKSQQGDASAFESLVTMYQGRIYGLSYHLTGNHDDAQDLAQEAFIRAHSALGRFRGDADFGTWLHRITVNTWINLQRSRKKHNFVSLDEPYEMEDGQVQRETAAASDNPEALYEEKEFRQLVRHALSELTEEHRAVLVLRDVHGYSYDEVARILDCTLGTVKSRINRARLVMKEKLTFLAKRSGYAIPFAIDRQGGDNDGLPASKNARP